MRSNNPLFKKVEQNLNPLFSAKQGKSFSEARAKSKSAFFSEARAKFKSTFFSEARDKVDE